MTRSVLNSASFADNSVTTAKIANNAVATAKIANNAITKNKSGTADYLKPVWINFLYNAGGNSSHRFVSNYGKKIYCNNGNNGPAVMAMLDGSTGTGQFIVEWIPGYYWGWSGIYLTEKGGLNTESNGDFSPNWMNYSPAGYKQIGPQNNSSNIPVTIINVNDNNNKGNRSVLFFNKTASRDACGKVPELKTEECPSQKAGICPTHFLNQKNIIIRKEFF